MEIKFGSESAKEQPRKTDETGKTIFDSQVVQQSVVEPEKVVQQNVAPPSKEHKKQQAKAKAAKVNMGAVARGNKERS